MTQVLRCQNSPSPHQRALKQDGSQRHELILGHFFAFMPTPSEIARSLQAPGLQQRETSDRQQLSGLAMASE